MRWSTLGLFGILAVCFFLLGVVYFLGGFTGFVVFESLIGDSGEGMIYLPENLSVFSGGSGSFNLVLSDRDGKFSGDCQIRAGDDYPGWLLSFVGEESDISGMVFYDIEIEIPDFVEAGEYSVPVILECDEGRWDQSFMILVSEEESDEEIESYEVDGENEMETLDGWKNGVLIFVGFFVGFFVIRFIYLVYLLYGGEDEDIFGGERINAKSWTMERKGMI